MLFRSLAIAAATAVAFTGAPASAASYDAFSFVHTDKTKLSHSLKFKKRAGVFHNRLRGAKGKGRKKFGFENGSGGSMGTFVTSGNTATLTGTLKNKAGQSYDVVMHFDITSNPGSYKNRAGASMSDWSFYKMTSGTLTSTSGDLASFDLFHKGKMGRGAKRRAAAVQFGTGANGMNKDMMGLFALFKAVEQGCDPSQGKCQRFKGNLKLSLDPSAASPATSIGDDDGGTANVPLPATALMLPAALGGLGLAGFVGRRRRKA